MSVDAINDLLGNIGFGFSKIVDKVKSTATEAAAKYQEMSPQAQAIKAGAAQLKSGSKATPSSTVTSSVIPTTKSSYKTGTSGISNMFSGLMKKKMFGIPVLFVGLGGVFVGLPILKKLGRKK